MRMGALPYPGLALHKVVDPDDLGRHRYNSLFRPFDGEVERGIIYTRHGGFVDVAHIRDASDWTQFYAMRARDAMRRGEREVDAEGPDATRVHLTFTYPNDWNLRTEDDRERTIGEIAIRAGQEAGYGVSVMHEVLTWHGYSHVFFISEKPSAFTYDDTVSHLIGLRVAERAWLSDAPTYDQAVEAAIYAELDELGAYRPELTRQAVEIVRGDWWERGHVLVRHFDVGYDDRRVTPMVVPVFSSSGGEPDLHLPGLIDLVEDDVVVKVELEPTVRLYRDELAKQLPGSPTRLTPAVHLPMLIDRIREENGELPSETHASVTPE